MWRISMFRVCRRLFKLMYIYGAYAVIVNGSGNHAIEKTKKDLFRQYSKYVLFPLARKRKLRTRFPYQ